MSTHDYLGESCFCFLGAQRKEFAELFDNILCNLLSSRQAVFLEYLQPFYNRTSKVSCYPHSDNPLLCSVFHLIDYSHTSGEKWYPM